jgi:hypothetical protein
MRRIIDAYGPYPDGCPLPSRCACLAWVVPSIDSSNWLAPVHVERIYQVESATVGDGTWVLQWVLVAENRYVRRRH